MDTIADTNDNQEFQVPKLEKNGSTVDLTSKGLVSIKPELLMKRFDAVTTLGIADNKLKFVPRGLITAFPNVIILDLSRNEMNRLPFDIYKWEKLEVLMASSNDINLLPATIGEMNSLKYLNMKDNPLAIFSSDTFNSDFKWNKHGCMEFAKNVVMLAKTEQKMGITEDNSLYFESRQDSIEYLSNTDTEKVNYETKHTYVKIEQLDELETKVKVSRSAPNLKMESQYELGGMIKKAKSFGSLESKTPTRPKKEKYWKLSNWKRICIDFLKFVFAVNSVYVGILLVAAIFLDKYYFNEFLGNYVPFYECYPGFVQGYLKSSHGYLLVCITKISVSVPIYRVPPRPGFFSTCLVGLTSIWNGFTFLNHKMFGWAGQIFSYFR